MIPPPIERELKPDLVDALLVYETDIAYETIACRQILQVQNATRFSHRQLFSCLHVE